MEECRQTYPTAKQLWPLPQLKWNKLQDKIPSIQKYGYIKWYNYKENDNNNNNQKREIYYHSKVGEIVKESQPI